jgi:hypothetical protein
MKFVSPKTLNRAAKELANADLERRQAAADRILTPEMVGARGKKNATAAAKLMTTLGGKPRAITTEDLKVFKHAVQKLQADRTHVAGITAADILSQSTPEDLARSKAEIAHAVPFRFVGGHVSFNSSSSGKYGASRHIVQIEFAGWSQAVGSPIAPLAAAKVCADQPLRFECDCGRHTFFYRYIATIGGWNHGRTEDGFPKIRNPHLTGVACKHVLRVMVELSGSGVRGQIARAIQQERHRLAGKTKKTVLNVQKAHAHKITNAQAAKPRDVEKVALKLQKLLTGKAPAAALKPLPPSALEREAATTRARLIGLGMSRAQADQVAAAILSTGAPQ